MGKMRKRQSPIPHHHRDHDENVERAQQLEQWQSN